MITAREHKIKNDITDITHRSIVSNPDLFDAYQGLPYKWTKISSSVFIHICKEVRYGKGAVKDGYNYLSNITPITIDAILWKIKSAEYNEGKNIANDRKNYRAQLVAIHDNNIFYMWKCGKFYVLFMERELRSWIYYNRNGCVVPKTMIKILDRAYGMINSMIKFHHNDGSRYTIIAIESSFGFFLNIMIDKMNPCIAEGLPRWEKDMHINQYIDILKIELEKLNHFDGLTEAPDYLDRLPAPVRQNLLKKMDKGGDMSSNMEKGIVPKGGKANLGKPPRKKRQKKVEQKKDPSEVGKPKKLRFNTTLQPLEKGPDLIKYYKAYLQGLAGTINIKFEEVQIDSGTSVEIIDLLRIHGVKNKDFLDAWIEYFYEHRLKGDKISKDKYTALRVFRYTFDRFKETYYVP